MSRFSFSRLFRQQLSAAVSPVRDALTYETACKMLERRSVSDQLPVAPDSRMLLLCTNIRRQCAEPDRICSEAHSHPQDKVVGQLRGLVFDVVRIRRSTWRRLSPPDRVDSLWLWDRRLASARSQASAAMGLNMRYTAALARHLLRALFP